MDESKNRFRVILMLLPLAALTAGVLWHVSAHRPGKDHKSGATTAVSARTAGRTTGAGALGGPAENIFILDIQGSPEFKGQVAGALKLIRLYDPEAFLFIQKSLYVVRNENKTDFYLDGGRPVAAISNAHAFRSLPWCAGMIAHQAIHSYAEFSSRKRRFTPPPPGVAKTLTAAANPMIFEAASLDSILALEKKASEFQMRVLAATGASRAELRSVRDRTPRDFSTGHDGNYFLAQ